MDVFCGINRAEDHHDVALTDRDGQLLARRRISDDAAGLAALLSLLAEPGNGADDPVPVAIETPRGLLVACLRATGRRSTPSTRWPWPGTVTGTRSRPQVRPRRRGRPGQHLRTDMHAHRPLPADSELPRRSRCWPAPSKTPSGTAPARTTSSARTCASTSPASWPPSPSPRRHHAPRSPRHPGRRPEPAAAATLTLTQLRSLLRKAGRAAASTPRPPGCATPSARADAPATASRTGDGPPALALLRHLDAACASADDLEQAATAS